MNNFIDTCRLMGNYNDKDVYLYTSAKYDAPRLFYNPNYYLLPKLADPQTLTFMQAVKIINFRMKHKNSDNMKPNDLNIDTLIQEIKEK